MNYKDIINLDSDAGEKAGGGEDTTIDTSVDKDVQEKIEEDLENKRVPYKRVKELTDKVNELKNQLSDVEKAKEKEAQERLKEKEQYKELYEKIEPEYNKYKTVAERYLSEKQEEFETIMTDLPEEDREFVSGFISENMTVDEKVAKVKALKSRILDKNDKGNDDTEKINNKMGVPGTVESMSADQLYRKIRETTDAAEQKKLLKQFKKAKGIK
jgi:DNA repair exonuclease SbcCD ATPase subunit